MTYDIFEAWFTGDIIWGGPFALVLGIVTIDYEEETKVKTTLLKLEWLKVTCLIKIWINPTNFDTSN